VTDDKREDQREEHTGSVAATTEEQYGVGPFSIREVALIGTWLVAFVISFFPIAGSIGVGPSVWSNGIDWVLTIGLPTVAVFLIVLRRLSPQGIRRVGSLGIDQFASVAFSVATVLWLTMIWNSFITLANQRVFVATWVVWVEFFLLLAGVLLTVFAPFIAPFAQDFRGRPDVVAHRNARPVRPVTARPAPAPRPEAATDDAQSDGAYADFAAPTETSAPAFAEEPTPTAETTAYPAATAYAARGDETTAAVAGTGTDTRADTETGVAESAAPVQARESFEPVETPASTVEPAAATAPRNQAFWALVPEERDVVDEIGIPVFRIGPTAWALVIEDRGEVFVVRHEDGRIGYLHDTTGVTRG
jgi:pyruvate/2-oxoglutarate dehydrogenase complex dihydrolipoamide acyltransferase (E2) component